MSVKRVNRASIDVSKWNALIKQAHNSLPYGYAWYLDAVSENWEALILNDYQAVLPLPFVKKMGFKLYVQPLFNQQLGPFSLEPLNAEQLTAISNELPTSSLFFNLNFSEELISIDANKKFNPSRRINQIISLETSIEEIEQNLNRSVRRNVKAGLSNFGDLQEIHDPKEVIEFYRAILNEKVGLREGHYDTLLQLFNKALENKSVIFHQLKHKETDTVVCNGAVIVDEHRIINLFSASSKKKIYKGAASTYIYQLLTKYACKKKIFDFEGSDIPGINKFFTSFGATTTYYSNFQRIHPLLKLVYKAKVYLRTRKIKR